MPKEVLRIIRERLIFDEVLEDVWLDQNVKNDQFLYEFKERAFLVVFVRFWDHSVNL